MRLTRDDMVAAGVFGAEGALALAIYWFGRTGPVPMHFSLSGQVDRWGDRTQTAVVAGVSVLVTATLYVLLPALSVPRVARPGVSRAIPIARLIILILSVALSLLSAAIAFGLLNQGSPLPIPMGILSLMLLAMGSYLGKVEPNPIAGVRTYWSLRSRLAWDKSNRLFARIAFWVGLAGLLAFPFAPQPLGLQLVFGGLIVAAIAGVFESWRVWRNDPMRVQSPLG